MVFDSKTRNLLLVGLIGTIILLNTRSVMKGVYDGEILKGMGINSEDFFGSSSVAVSTELGPIPAKVYEDSICRVLQQASGQGQIASTSAIWGHNLDRILQASRHPLDKDFSQKTFVHNLLLDLTPDYLQRGVKSRINRHDIKRIADILEKRQHNPTKNPPLKVLVMGGSVTEGVGCQQSKEINGRTCNWSVRMQHLVNDLLGFQGVEVHNIANGGTNTAQALSLVRYWLYPNQVLPAGPDIIVHGFAVNDCHVGSATESDPWDHAKKLVKQGVERLNSFVKEVYYSKPCPEPPIIFFLDEYIGTHNQASTMGDVIYNMIMTRMATWHQNLAVTSNDIIREFVYMDVMNEKIFSPAWRKGKNGHFRENPHFGWGGHQMITWAWAYAFLDSMVNYCDTDWKEGYNNDTQAFGAERKSTHTETIKKLVQLHEENTVLRPPLGPGIFLEDISDFWEKSAAEFKARNCSNSTNQVAAAPPCMFAWISGMEGRTRFVRQLQKYLKPYQKRMDGWSIKNDMSLGWSRKLGIEVVQPDGIMEFELANLAQPIRKFEFNSIKSYGDKWMGSKVKIFITSSDQKTTYLDGVEVTGFHESKSSITYTSTFDLSTEAPVGSSVNIRVQMVNGTSFKVMGMMACSR